MVKKRLIATLLVYMGQIVQTRRFKRTNPVGSAFTAVDFFNGWAVDEIVVLEISHNEDYLERFIKIVDELSRRCFVPLAVGGKIHNLDLVRRYTRVGADKVVVNTAAVQHPALITEIAEEFGTQCVVLSLDACSDPSAPSGYQIVVNNARERTERDAVEWAMQAVDRGAGEILVNSTEHDGEMKGYDLNLVRAISEVVSVPVIAMGGVGHWDHLAEGLTIGGADAVAAGNIFHYTEHSTKKAKEHLLARGLSLRASAFYKVHLPRKPRYVPF